MDWNKIKNGLGPELNAYMESSNDNDQENVNQEGSFADEPVSYVGYIEDSVFAGELPFGVILEGLRNQFANYVSTEDRTDYVDSFYRQYKMSTEIAYEEQFTDDYLDALSKYMDKWLAVVNELFLTKLELTLTDLEGEATNNDSIEQSIRILYNYFILNAPATLKTVISKPIVRQLKKETFADDREMYKKIQEMLISGFSPIISAVGPMEFIRLSGNEEVQELFNNGRVVGNFLKRYSPRFYKNEDFEASVVVHITETLDLYNDIIKGGEPNGATENINQHTDS